MRIKRLYRFAPAVLFGLCSLLAGTQEKEKTPPAQEPAKKPGTITGTVKSLVKKPGLTKATNVVVYLEKAEGTFDPPKDNPVMDQKDMTFLPRVLPVLQGTTVVFSNNEQILHNVYSPDYKGKGFDLGNWGQGEKRTHTFDEPGTARILCQLHSSMIACVVVLQNPYFAMTEVPKDKTDGTYTLKDVPPGRYILKTWHEKFTSASKDVEVRAGETITVDFELSLGDKK